MDYLETNEAAPLKAFLNEFAQTDQYAKMRERFLRHCREEAAKEALKSQGRK